MSEYLFPDVDMPESEPTFSSGEDFTDLSQAVGAPAAGAGAYHQADPPPSPKPIRIQPTRQPITPSMGSFLLQSEPPVSSSMGILPILGAVGLAAVGGAMGGVWGVAAGAAASGAVVNLVRSAASRSSGDTDQASAHLIFAVVSAGVAAYTGREAYLSRQRRMQPPTKVAPNRMEMPRWLKQ